MAKWLNSKQAGEYLGLSDWTIRDYAKRQLIEHSRLPGGDYRFTAEQLDAFMEARKVSTKTPIAITEKQRLQPLRESMFTQKMRKLREKRRREEKR